ncbi:MAG: hypothetical protein MJZ26_03650 [Fibrobacter sp.]|nr:hypothetical protein [Fibrobacter sp.]
MKFAKSLAVLVFGAVLGGQAMAQDVNHFEYFDCWLEKAASIVPAERARIGAKIDSDAVCGCFKVREKGGFGWRGNDEPKQITRVYELPKPRLISCADGSCDNGNALQQCMDNVRQTSFALSDFVDGHPMAGVVPLGFDEGWEMTPFGEYFNKRADRARDITCFLNVHGRPDADPAGERNSSGVFSVSGLPKKLIPEAMGRFTDYSDVRCLDGGELTGFAFNGYKENVRHVDAQGLLSGEEIGYMNDPTYPTRQDKKWGQVLWTSNYKNGMREGVSTFYKSSVYDGVNNSTYYFKHLEVPYKQGYVDGNVKMFSDKGFLMAEFSVKRGGLHGRTVIHNPFKKKNVNLTFAAGKLEGFVDFGEFGGVFHEGLPNGVVTFWSVQDTCYDWMPGATLCYTERVKKRQWGAYKMGVFQGKMECYNGSKGGLDMNCPDPVLDSIARDPHEIARVAREKSEKAKAEVKKAQEILAVAQQDLKRAEETAAKAEEEAVAAEKAAVAADSAKAAGDGAAVGNAAAAGNSATADNAASADNTAAPKAGSEKSAKAKGKAKADKKSKKKK